MSPETIAAALPLTDDLPDLDARRVPQAGSLQRKGMTFTEIARAMRVNRESVVWNLYYRKVS